MDKLIQDEQIKVTLPYQSVLQENIITNQL